LYSRTSIQRLGLAADSSATAFSPRRARVSGRFASATEREYNRAARVAERVPGGARGLVGAEGAGQLVGRRDGARLVVALHHEADGVAGAHARALARLAVEDHVVRAVALREDGAAEGEAVDGAADGDAPARAEGALDIERHGEEGRLRAAVRLELDAEAFRHER
jgi:hypothetical protein